MKNCHVWFVLLFVLNVACVTADTTTADAGDTEYVPASGHAVIVERNTIYLAEDGGRTEVARPRTAQLHVDTSEGFLSFDGELADTQLIFREIPDAGAWIQVGNTWVVGVDDYLDLGITQTGRADWHYVDAGVSAVNVTLSNFPDWASGDSLRVFSAGAPLYTDSLHRVMEPAAVEGSPVTTFSFDYGSLYGGRTPGVDATRGDSFIINELRASTLAGSLDGGFGCSYSIAAAVLTDATVVDGTNDWLGVLDVRAPSLVDYAYPRTAWAAHAAEMHPAAQVTTESLALVAEPAPGTSSGDLFVCENDPRTQAPINDVSAQWSLADPFPSNWPRVIYATTTAQVSRGIGPSEWVATGTTGVRLTAGQPIVPGVHVPSAFTIDGTGASELTSLNVNNRVLVAWAEPLQGPTPSRYDVSVQKLSQDQNQQSQAETMANFITTETSLRLPPGLFEGGSVYVISVMSSVGDASRSRVNDRALHSWATAFSNPFLAQ